MSAVGPLCALAAVVAGILAGQALGPGPATTALLVAIVLLIVALLTRGKRGLVISLIACALLGGAVTQRALHGLEVSPLQAAVARRAHVTVDGTLVDDPSGPRFIVEVLARLSDVDGAPAGDRTVVLVGGGDVTTRLRVLEAGDRVTVTGTLEPLSGFDTRYRWRHAVASVRVAELVAFGAPTSPLDRLANRSRAAVLRGAEGLPATERALLAGFLLGDTRALPDDLVDDFRDAGLSHLLAVSGANVAFVFAIAIDSPFMRAVTYCRQSVTRDGSESLDRQQEACAREAKRLKLTVVAELTEAPSTGAFKDRGRGRPEFLRLIDLIDSGQVDAVVAYKTDRLSRGGGSGWAPLVDAFERRGLNLDRVVATADGGWVSEVELGMRAVFDREESKKTSDRILSLRLREAQQGLPRIGSTRPFGYEKDGMTVRESEAAVVREVAQRLIAGATAYSIALDLNARGLFTSGGKHWSTTTLLAVMRSARIRGLRTHHGTIYPGTWPALLDPETIRKLDAAAKRPSRAPKARSYLLTGHLTCECGASLQSSTRSGGTKTYVCSSMPGRGGCGGTRIVAHSLEEYVAQIAIERLSLPKVRRQIASLLANMGDDPAEALQALQERRERIADAFLDGLITRAESRRRTAEVDAEVAALTRKRSATALALPDDLGSWWETATFDQRRELVSLAVEGITIIKATRPSGSRGLDRDRIKVKLRG